MKKLAHFCGIMLAATSFMFQSCDDSDGYSIGDIAVDWPDVPLRPGLPDECMQNPNHLLTVLLLLHRLFLGRRRMESVLLSYSIRCMMIFKDMIALSR